MRASHPRGRPYRVNSLSSKELRAFRRSPISAIRQLSVPFWQDAAKNGLAHQWSRIADSTGRRVFINSDLARAIYDGVVKQDSREHRLSEGRGI